MAKKTKAATEKNKPVASTKKRSFKKVIVGTQFWKPEAEGDTIEGTFVEFKEQQKYKGKKGEMTERVILRDDEGTLWMLPDHWQINAAVKANGEGYYQISVEKMGGEKEKGKGKSSSYQYEILWAKA